MGAYTCKDREGTSGASSSVNTEVSLATEKQKVSSLGIMAASFIFLGLTNRYSWMIFCYFGIGYAGGILCGSTTTSHLGDDFDMHHSQNQKNMFHSIGGGITEGMRVGTISRKGATYRPSSAELTRRAIACFMLQPF